jgi:hypothetical protein
MFELSKSEVDDLSCQIGTSKWGGTRYIPFAFTEQGVAMLSGVLNSDRAIKVNIQIILMLCQTITSKTIGPTMKKHFSWTLRLF